MIAIQDIVNAAISSNNYGPGDKSGTVQNKYLQTPSPDLNRKDVYFVSESLVNWMGPETLARYLAATAASGGAALPLILGEIKALAASEGISFARWAESNGHINHTAFGRVAGIYTELIFGSLEAFLGTRSLTQSSFRAA